MPITWSDTAAVAPVRSRPSHAIFFPDDLAALTASRSGLDGVVPGSFLACKPSDL